VTDDGRDGSEQGRPAAPEPWRRPPVRFSWVGVAALGAAGVVAFAVTVGVFLPALAEIGNGAARDPANLPDTITVCARDWRKDALDRALTRDEVFERTEAEPVVVPTGLLAGCPPGVRVGDAMMTVVYAQVGEDSFVPYELVGGP
jgi:hypothetical protein